MSHTMPQFETAQELDSERMRRAAEMVSDLERFLAAALSASASEKGGFRWPRRYNEAEGWEVQIPLNREPSRVIAED